MEQVFSKFLKPGPLSRIKVRSYQRETRIGTRQNKTSVSLKKMVSRWQHDLSIAPDGQQLTRHAEILPANRIMHLITNLPIKSVITRNCFIKRKQSFAFQSSRLLGIFNPLKLILNGNFCFREMDIKTLVIFSISSIF